MMLDALLGDDAAEQREALAAASAAPEHERSALANTIAVVAKDAAAALADDDADRATSFKRACIALATLRVGIAKSTLLRVADEGTKVAKGALARALAETTTPEGRAVLVHLLSDDDARDEAIVAIGEAPWPEVLPALIEVAEADDLAARLAAAPIAKCGAASGPEERNAAADFLLEQLDDDVVLPAAVDALVRFGAGFVGITERARRLAKETGRRKIAGLCLVAAFGDEDNAGLLELALAGAKTDDDAARSFLEPRLSDPDERVRSAARRTWNALALEPDRGA